MRCKEFLWWLHIQPNLCLWKGVGRKCNPGIMFALSGVWRNEPTHSRVDSHFGSWNPCGVSSLQRGIPMGQNCRDPSSRPRQRLARMWAKRKPKSHISCSQECKRVWGNEPSHSQRNSHFGNWRPGGFSNLQRAIVGGQTHWIEAFLISLERFWNENVWNRLTWPIWTSKT
jgi:hypothetical protein